MLLVNAGTSSAGDILTYDLATCPNVTVMGLTTTWGCAQGVAQTALMSGGSIRVRYSIMATLDEEGNIYIDADENRVSSIPLDVRIPLDMNAINEIYGQETDYPLDYAVEWIDTLG